jgi:S-adenosylmethionine:tRNA ribosyltransferase-isomerase
MSRTYFILNIPIDPVYPDSNIWNIHMKLRDFNYTLPSHLIAQKPATKRDASRLMVLFRDEEKIIHSRFSDLPDFLNPGEIMVMNESKVIPARLKGRKKDTGATIEILLSRPVDPSNLVYRAIAKPMKRLSAGTLIEFGPAFVAEILDKDGEFCTVQFSSDEPLNDLLERYGETPLPPYITQRNPDDRERYQTLYARVPGSVAAPTAGLHFTEKLFARLVEKGILLEKLILHVGPGTFMPLRGGEVEGQMLDEEEYHVSEATTKQINRVRKAGMSLIAVGTTTTRVLESVANSRGRVYPGSGCTSKYIHPGYRFRVVDVLITNFHLPCSSLLLLVCAFAGRDFILHAYKTAISMDYRFYSYGDAMLIR